jgi:hypothetical protein
MGRDSEGGGRREEAGGAQPPHDNLISKFHGGFPGVMVHHSGACGQEQGGVRGGAAPPILVSKIEGGNPRVTVHRRPPAQWNMLAGAGAMGGFGERRPPNFIAYGDSFRSTDYIY